MQDDMFSSVAAKATTIPPKPSATSGDMFDDVAPVRTSAPALTVNNIPAGSLAMTDPSGQLQAVPHTQAAAMMQKGYKIGPPTQQGGQVSAGGEFARSFIPDSSTASAAGGRAVDLVKGLGGLVNPIPDADMRQRIKANMTGQPQSFGDMVQGAVEGVPVAGPITSRLIGGVTSGADTAVRQSAAQAREAAKVKDDPLGKALAYARAGVTGVSSLNPMATGSVTNINQLEDAGKPKEALGAGATDIAAILGGPKAAKVGLRAAQALKIKALPTAALTPAEQVAKTAAPSKVLQVHDAAKVTLADIQKASADLGKPITSVRDAVDAVQKAKQNLAMEAQAKLPEGQTLQDMSAPEKAAYQKQVEHLDTMQEHFEGLEKQKTAALEKSAKAKGPFAESPVLRAGAKVLSPRVVAAGDLLAASRNAAAAKGVAAAGQIDNAVAGAFKPQTLSPQLPQSLGQAPGPDPFAAPVGPVNASAPQPTPSGVPSLTGDVPGSGLAAPAGAPTGGPLTSTAQLAQPPSGFPQPQVTTPSGVSATPEPGSIAMRHPDQPGMTLHMHPDLVAHAKKAGFEVVKNSEATKPANLTQSGNKVKSNVDKNRRFLGLDKPASAEPAQPWQKAIRETSGSTESPSSSADQNTFEKKVMNHFPDPGITPGTLSKLWDKISPHVTKVAQKVIGGGQENIVLDIAKDKVVKIAYGKAQTPPDIPEVLQPIESGSIDSPETASKGGMHYHVMPKADNALFTRSQIQEMESKLAAKGWAMKEGEAHPANFGMYKGEMVVLDPSGMKRIPIKK